MSRLQLALNVRDLDAAIGHYTKLFGVSPDPERPVPIVVDPEDITIAVAGDPLRTNCYFLSHNGMLGYQTTRRVELPAAWRERLREREGA